MINSSPKQLYTINKFPTNAKGIRGLYGLERTFSIADDHNKNRLSLFEFKKCLKDYRMKLTEIESDKIFNIFDKKRTGNIDYSAFMRSVIGEMNPKRKAVVDQAYRSLGKGILLDDLKNKYSAAKHPDVAAGKRTEEDQLAEFLDTFELQHQLKKGGKEVSEEEFSDYYTHVSMGVKDDAMFEKMVKSSWEQ